ncbi:MAG: hypothetical protein LBP85_07600 [Prevotellaceae bacterium]|nr:hypothetical protein [Prevotellaceae bacterium]
MLINFTPKICLLRHCELRSRKQSMCHCTLSIYLVCFLLPASRFRLMPSQVRSSQRQAAQTGKSCRKEFCHHQKNRLKSAQKGQC